MGSLSGTGDDHGFDPTPPSEAVPPTPPMPDRTGSSKFQSVRAGVGHTLVQDRGSYAIVRSGGSRRHPLYSFPPDQQGWERAWRTFWELEAHHTRVGGLRGVIARILRGKS